MHIAVYLQALVVALCSQDSVSTEDMRAVEIKVRYAVVLDGAEPFSAEVTCQTDRECDLVDKWHPGIKVAIFRAHRGGDSRLKAYCSPRDCVLPGEAEDQFETGRQTVEVRVVGRSRPREFGSPSPKKGDGAGLPVDSPGSRNIAAAGLSAIARR
ncbi:hypothetical protein [Rhizobium sp. BK538]|uniref:hypothetical protein n=1 Tax=Rhizobium sp. BK538 TaxID=2586984 RepID=UPI00160D750A|nr:hypothetical protein [Rhizobium sp. BK538]MBB4168696.1 hypothetical protein [Rhizobium sp. BK538]